MTDRLQSLPENDPLRASLAELVAALAPHAETLAASHYIEVSIHADGTVHTVEAGWLRSLFVAVRS